MSTRRQNALLAICWCRQIWLSLNSGSHIPENFCQIKVFPGLVQKISSNVYLMFENEHKRVLKV